MKFLSLLIVSLILLSSCTRDMSALDKDQGSKIRIPSAIERQVIEASSEFGQNLFGRVSSGNPESNCFISPLSVSMALGMTLNGADSQTYEEMKVMLGFENLTAEEINSTYKNIIQELIQANPDIAMHLANAIFYRQGFSIFPDFLTVNQSYFNAEVSGLDFDDPQSVNTINGWVSDQTQGTIPTVLDEIKPETVMFLINAIYFKAQWLYKFDKAKTEDALFYTSGQNSVDCQMMHLEAEVPYTGSEQFEMAELPYDSNFVFDLIVPTGASLPEIVSAIQDGQLNTWLEGLTRREGTVEMPKFTFDFNTSLVNYLQELGMIDAFIPGIADLSRISEQERLFISDVIHKSFVKVEEEGTEASAVTVVEVGYTSYPPSGPFHLRADRPFIFLIREKVTGAILFIGQVYNPEWKA